MIRRLALVGLLGAVALPVAAPAPAHAAAYRYWSYWHGDGGWTYASTGPGGYRPADGSVEGWRLAVSTEGASVRPRTSPDFTAVCGATPAQDGRKRVAVVIDYGVAADAPSGQSPPRQRTACAVVATSARGSAVLSAVAAIRADSTGLVCGLDGYPSRGCGEVVAAPRPSASKPAVSTPSPSRSASSKPSASGPASSRPSASVPASSRPATRGVRPTSTSAAGTPAAATPQSTSPQSATTPPGTTAPTTPATADQPTAPDSGSPAAASDPALVDAAGSTEDAGPPWGLLAGIVAVLAVATAAAVRLRRDRGRD